MYQKRINYTLLYLLLLLLPLLVVSTTTFAKDSEPATFSLLCDKSSHQNLNCALNISVNNGWKVYAHHPKNYGSEFEINLNKDKSNNIVKITSDWSKPQIIKNASENITTYLYDSHTIIPIDAVVTPDAEYKITLDLKYAACNKYCGVFKQEISYDVLQNGVNISNSATTAQFFYMLMLAMLGGLILNFMPCVLPVVGIKISHLVKKYHDTNSNIKYELLFICLGIISSFAAFGFFTVLLRFLGRTMDWGMHFQEPIFVMFIITVTAIASANTFGLFDIGLPQCVVDIVNRIEGKITPNQTSISDFLHGAFLVLLATPCTAPFLGTAVAFAITQNNVVIFCIYLAIGIGMGVPYMLIMAFPNTTRRIIPRPGKWLQYLKFTAATLLLWLSIWLCSVLAEQVGVPLLIVFMFSLFIVILLLSWQSISKITKFTKKTVLLGLTSLGIIFIMICSHYSNDVEEQQLSWVEFNTTKLTKHIVSDDIIVVNITAAWCVTCKMNEERVLKNSDVINTLLQGNVVLLRGNYTSGSDEITGYIAQQHRSGIPLTVVYGPNSRSGIVLPIVFNKQDLFSAIDKVK